MVNVTGDKVYTIENSKNGTYEVKSKTFEPAEFESTNRSECVAYIDEQRNNGKWRYYIIADLMTWAVPNLPKERSDIEYFCDFDDAKDRFFVLKNEAYNYETTPLNQSGRPYVRLAMGIDRIDGTSAIDVLHVRQGKNYLVDDFTRNNNHNTNKAVLQMLSRISSEIGFERVHPYVKDGEGRYQLGEEMAFSDWENPYF